MSEPAQIAAAAGGINLQAEYSRTIREGKAKIPLLLADYPDILTIRNSSEKISFSENYKEDYEGALTNLIQAQEFSTKENPEDLLLSGIIYARLFVLEEALDCFTRVIVLSPKNSEAYLWRSAVKEWQNDIEGANEDLVTAANLGNKTAKEFIKIRTEI